MKLTKIFNLVSLYAVKSMRIIIQVVFLSYSFSDILYQEESGPSQNSEIACKENLSSETCYGNDHLLLQGNNEQEVVFIDPCDNQIDILLVEAHEEPKILEAHEESNILEMVVAFKVFHEHPKPCLLGDRNEYFNNQIDDFSLTNIYEVSSKEPEDIEQQEEVLYVLEDPFANILKSSVEIKFVFFANIDIGFNFSVGVVITTTLFL